MSQPLPRTDPAEIAALLRRHGLRVTPQRRAIWSAFTSAEDDHPTADEVFRRAQAELPELSRATVYNALGELVAAGLLGLVEGPGPQRYDVNLQRHHHFRYRCCGRLYDIQPTGVDSVKLAAEGFAVERAQLLLEGLCPCCSG